MALPGVSVFNRASGRGCNARRRQLRHNRVVEPLDQIVPLLVQLVDGPLHRRQIGVAGIGAAGDVLLVPKAEVLLVLEADQAKKSLVRVVDLLLVPARHRRLVQFPDRLDIDHRSVSLLGKDQAVVE